MIVERWEQFVAARVPHRPGAEIDAAVEKLFKQVAGMSASIKVGI